MLRKRGIAMKKPWNFEPTINLTLSVEAVDACATALPVGRLQWEHFVRIIMWLEE